MTALLRKDIYVADKQARLLIGLAVIFCLIPKMETFGSTYAMMAAFMIPLNSLAYDEKSKWDRYAAMLPYRVSQLVGSKYLLSIIYTAGAIAIVIAGAALRSVIFKTAFDWTEIGEMALMLVIVLFLIMNLTLPMLFRFGSERGRMLMILMLALAIGAGLGIVKVARMVDAPSLPVPAIIAAVAAGGVVLTVVSIRLSMRFYKNRRDGKYN